MTYDVIEPGVMAVALSDLPMLSKKKPITPVNLATLLTYEFPIREAILSPVFVLSSLNMIFARRGIGKTHASLGIAYAAASGGSFWGWRAARPYRVLLIDGEMPGGSLQGRMAAIVAASDVEPDPENLQTITIDMQGGVMPDLSTVEGQNVIEEACQAAELIIVDNLSCLCRSGRENESESWVILSEWALRMRSAGKCVIFVHHAGKNGDQRGTSKKEDILDVVIELKRPADYDSEQGARFIVNYSKARHLTGQDAQQFEAWLQSDEHGREVWTTQAVTESTHQQVIELANLGLSQADIAAELDINKSTVCRHIAKAKESGLLGDKSKKPFKTNAARRADIDD
ncbi:MAG: AAA family ATPase [Methylosarcina sp.]